MGAGAASAHLDPNWAAEGLDQIEGFIVESAVRSGRIASLRKNNRSLDEGFTALADSLGSPGKVYKSISEWRKDNAGLLSGVREYGLWGEEGFEGEQGSSAEEKFAIRVALSVLGGASPQVMAKALGAALSTLYSYSDNQRPNRPGKKRLYQAAYLLHLLGREMHQTAEYLTNVARRSKPLRTNKRDGKSIDSTKLIRTTSGWVVERPDE